MSKQKRTIKEILFAPADGSKIGIFQYMTYPFFLLPMLSGFLWQVYGPNVVNLANWKALLVLRILMSVLYSISLVWIFYRYIEVLKKKPEERKLKRTALIILGYVVLTAFLFFLNPVTAYKDLKQGSVTYQGGCTVDSKVSYSRVWLSREYYITLSSLPDKKVVRVKPGDYNNLQSNGTLGIIGIEGVCSKSVRTDYLHFSGVSLNVK